jgi:cytochrome c peroxidase
MRTLALAVVVSLTLVLPACGAGADNEWAYINPPVNTPGEAETLNALVVEACEAAGVDPVPRPQPESRELVELGRMLFFDKELSGNRDISCATCHHPAAWTGDSLPVSIGAGGFGLGVNRAMGSADLIPRNAPHVFNGGVVGADVMFWDGRLRRDPATGVLETPEPLLNGPSPGLPDHVAQLTSALAAQAMFPVTSHHEMRGAPGSNADLADAPHNRAVWAALMVRLGAIPGYVTLFHAAFPGVATFGEFTFGHAARAIAAFERQAWTALDSPFDRFLGGDMSALSMSARRGAALFFGEARCANCHNGPLLSDFRHHALAVPQVGPGKHGEDEDLGRFKVTDDVADLYAFRTPALRNVALTGPWMHDGAFATLEAAVRHHLDPANSLLNYDATQLPPLFRDFVDDDPTRNGARIAAISPLLGAPIGLSDAQFEDLMAFLHSLTDPASLNMLADIPDAVPSGLPVRD